MSTSIKERFHERAIINIIRGEHDRIGVGNGDRGRYGRRGEKDGGDDHHNWEVVNAESGDEEPYGSDQTEATTNDRDDGEVFKIFVGGVEFEKKEMEPKRKTDLEGKGKATTKEGKSRLKMK